MNRPSISPAMTEATIPVDKAGYMSNAVTKEGVKHTSYESELTITNITGNYKKIIIFSDANTSTINLNGHRNYSILLTAAAMPVLITGL